MITVFLAIFAGDDRNLTIFESVKVFVGEAATLLPKIMEIETDAVYYNMPDVVKMNIHIPDADDAECVGLVMNPGKDNKWVSENITNSDYWLIYKMNS